MEKKGHRAGPTMLNLSKASNSVAPVLEEGAIYVLDFASTGHILRQGLASELGTFCTFAAINGR